MDPENQGELGIEIWNLQGPKHREGDAENTVRLLAIEIECGNVTVHQLRQIVTQLAHLKPVPKYLRELVAAAARLDPVPTAGPKLFVPLWDHRSCAEIAAQHTCECAGNGLVSRRVPHEWYPRGYSVAYCCRCPIGREVARVSDRRSVEDWEREFGANVSKAECRTLTTTIGW